MGIDNGDHLDAELEEGIEDEDETEVFNAETVEGRKQREALFYYVPSKNKS